MNYNAAIDVYRVLFTTLIMLHHFRIYSDTLPYGGGYMATDFFFMLSGLLIYEGFLKKQQQYCDDSYLKSIGKYIIKRFKRLVIPLTVCNLFMLLISYLVIDYRLPLGIKGFVKETLIFEIFTCDIADRFNPPSWYLGILLMTSVVWLTFLVYTEKKSKNLKFIFCMVLFALYMGQIYIKTSGNIYIEHAAILNWLALLRGGCGIGVGISIADIRQRYDYNGYSSLNRIIFALLIFVYLYLMAWRDGYNRSDIAVYVTIIIGVFVCSKDLAFRNRMISDVIKIFGKASYYAYIVHYPLVRILSYVRPFEGLDWKIYSCIFIVIMWSIAIALFILEKHFIGVRRRAYV